MNKFLVIGLTLLLSPAVRGQSVSINAAGAPPHAGAILDIQSGDQGVLLPRTATQHIATPSEGMIIYDTLAQGFMFYDGVQWLGIQTEEGGIFWYADRDGDGYGDAFNIVVSSVAPEYYVANNDDCDDNNPQVSLSGAEVCDNIDNDCDGLIDDDDPDVSGLHTYYQDSDNDGYGTAAVESMACTLPEGYAEIAGDCDDTDAQIHPGAQEVCDGVDNNCDMLIDDADGNLNSTAYYPDLDGDAFGDNTANPVFACSPQPGLANNNLDCDDSEPSIHPGAPEVCDGLDNDCNGEVDNSGSGTICVIAGVCYDDGDPNPANACQQCNIAQSTSSWSENCAPGMVCCEGTCVNLDTDAMHCSACGNDCEDGLACTYNYCDGGECLVYIEPLHCLINGVCYLDGESHPSNECLVCDWGNSQTQWSPADNGTLCDGGTCNNGACQ